MRHNHPLYGSGIPFCNPDQRFAATDEYERLTGRLRPPRHAYPSYEMGREAGAPGTRDVSALAGVPAAHPAYHTRLAAELRRRIGALGGPGMQDAEPTLHRGPGNIRDRSALARHLGALRHVYNPLKAQHTQIPGTGGFIPRILEDPYEDVRTSVTTRSMGIRPWKRFDSRHPGPIGRRFEEEEEDDQRFALRNDEWEGAFTGRRPDEDRLALEAAASQVPARRRPNPAQPIRGRAGMKPYWPVLGGPSRDGMRGHAGHRAGGLSLPEVVAATGAHGRRPLGLPGPSPAARRAPTPPRGYEIGRRSGAGSSTTYEGSPYPITRHAAGLRVGHPGMYGVGGRDLLGDFLRGDSSLSRDQYQRGLGMLRRTLRRSSLTPADAMLGVWQRLHRLESRGVEAEPRTILEREMRRPRARRDVSQLGLRMPRRTRGLAGLRSPLRLG